MILSEPDATACMPGETPIDTVSISTPLAAKNPFLVATTPGHTVAVGETWPNDTLVADNAGAAPSATVCSASSAGHTSLIPICIRIVSLALPSASPVSSPRRSSRAAGRSAQYAALSLRWSLCERAMHAQARSCAGTIAEIGRSDHYGHANKSVPCCNGISSCGRLGSAPSSRAPDLRRRGLFLSKPVRSRCGWRFESSRAHHAFPREPGFPEICQLAPNWRGSRASALSLQRRN